MQRSQISHKALFIVRYCGKSKLNEERYPCYQRAAAALIAQKPINGVTRKRQEMSDANPDYDPTKRKTKRDKKDVHANGNKQQAQTKKTYAQTVSPK